MSRWELGLIGVIVSMLVPACGPSSDGEKDDGENVVVVNSNPNNSTSNGTLNGSTNGVNSEPAATTEQVRLGLAAPREAHDAGVGALNLVAEGVFLASQLGAGGQQLVLTGTLTQQGQQLEFTYEASPSDKLVVAWSDGPPTEFVVSAFGGDYTGDAAHFVGSDHNVQFTVKREGVVDLEVASVRAGGQSRATMKGTLTDQEKAFTYTVDLVLAGSYTAEVGNSAEYESDEVFTGTITSDTGLSADVNEAYRFKLLYLENAVTNEERAASTTWTVDGISYSLQNHHIRYETLNGWANPTDYWIVQGEVFQDGQQIGTIGVEETEVWIEIYADVNGERVELQTFEKKQ